VSVCESIAVIVWGLQSDLERVRVCEREKENKERKCFVCVGGRKSVKEIVWVCVCVCVRERKRERERVGAVLTLHI